MAYTEERELNVRLVVRCRFDEGYEGDLDGYAWAKELPEITNEVLRAVVGALGHRPGWKLRGGNRGVATEDEVMLVLERTFGPSDR